MRRNLGWSRTLAGVLALVTGLTFAAPPAEATEVETAVGTTPTGQGSLAAATRAALARVDAASAVVVAPDAAGSSESKPFFKTGKGVAVLVLFVAGAAYTLYSKDKDRVLSPIR